MVAITILAFVTETWMVFVLLPLFALGGIGVPALQSLLSNEVGPDKQGQLQGVLASLLSLTSVFGPLIFSWVYFYAHTDWPGFIWLIGAGLYCFTAPLPCLAETITGPAIKQVRLFGRRPGGLPRRAATDEFLRNPRRRQSDRRWPPETRQAQNRARLICSPRSW